MKRNTRWTRLSLIAAASSAFGVSFPALAQTGMDTFPKPISVGILAGGSIPTGDFTNGAGAGWHVGGLAEWHSPLIPIGIRGEVAYHQFGSKDFTVSGVTYTVSPSIIPVTLNALLSAPMNQASTARPYLIGGVGIYNERASCNNCVNSGLTFSTSQNKFGLNGGAGISFLLSGFSSMMEARFHYILDSQGSGGPHTTFVPISFGIVF
jgi:opacity protein-like surface antigen